MAIQPPHLWRAFLRVAGDALLLLALAAGTGATVNVLRPESSRLPWRGDWEHHIEARAFAAGIPVVFLTGLRDRLATDPPILFDARPEPLYLAGHLPGALSLPVAEMDLRLGAFAARLTPDSPVVVYCDGNDCSDSLELALQLKAAGFSTVTLYPGGYAEWIAYNGPIETGSPP